MVNVINRIKYDLNCNMYYIMIFVANILCNIEKVPFGMKSIWNKNIEVRSCFDF